MRIGVGFIRGHRESTVIARAQRRLEAVDAAAGCWSGLTGADSLDPGRALRFTSTAVLQTRRVDQAEKNSSVKYARRQVPEFSP